MEKDFDNWNKRKKEINNEEIRKAIRALI